MLSGHGAGSQAMLPPRRLFIPALFAALAAPAAAQEPPSSPLEQVATELVYHTFSIAAVDPETGESGVAVTTRNACVGNAVPWVRAGVGAVATQAWSRLEYGHELLDILEAGTSPEEALAQRLAADENRERRQVGVIGLDGRSAQFTGEGTSAWAGHRAGTHFVAQGNLLVGPEVIDAVAEAFTASEGSGRHLSDRLIEAMEAGQAAGGDARSGRVQSAAVVVADPREGRAARPDGVSTDLNVCEHPTPVAELRRQWGAVSGTLGHRELQHPVGTDVAQLKIMLHALGYFRPDEEELSREGDWNRYTVEAVEAVDRFRADHGLSTPQQGGSPPGWVDTQLVELLWSELAAAGRALEVREAVRDLTAIRR